MTVVSFYMDNIPAEVLDAQRAVVAAFNPKGFKFQQILTKYPHGYAIDDYIHNSTDELIIILDIDCIPICSNALEELQTYALQNALVGCVQRANHIQNNSHLYIGAFCIAFSRTLWTAVGCPSFQASQRGDVGEEFTYRCEQAKRSVLMLWPSKCDRPLWPLTDNHYFGLNTEYASMFLHAFAIRNADNQAEFVQRCRDIVRHA
jgi:hypothetical protein